MRTSLRRLAILLFLFASGFLLILEFLDTPESINKAHLSREEGMTFRADIDCDIWFSGTCLEFGTAVAGDNYLIVLGVDVCFHGL